ncbi:MAG: ABC transporter permease [Actinomycetota bacterium]|nr:ABC transporter permease [Actinomycetota bacterium]
MSLVADVPTAVPAEPTVSSGRQVVRAVLRSPAGVVGVVLTATFVTVGLLAPWLAPADPFAIIGPPLSPPTASHPMGTDALGRDVLSGVIHGARTSLLIALGVGALVFVIGGAVGTAAGYRGGWLDDLLMRVTEGFQVLPRFFLALVVIAFFGAGLDRLVLVLGVTSWPMLARVVRSQTLSLRERDFVAAARACGASDARIVLREIWPSVLPGAVNLLGLLIAQAMLIEASLSFLGLGDPNAMSWGYLASEAQRFLRVAWWLSAFPGLAILGAVLGLNLLGDAVTHALGGRE